MQSRSRVVLLLLGTFAVGQTAPRTEAEWRAAIADLGDPQRAAIAIGNLIRAGGEGVPRLRLLLREVGPEQNYREQAASNALYVLGRLADAAIPALPEIRQCLAYGSLPVRNQAVWAIGQVAPRTRDRDVCRQCLSWLDLQRTADLDWYLYEATTTRLQLARGLRFRELRYRRPSELAGFAQSVAMGEVTPTPAQWQELADLLSAAVRRSDRPWEEDGDNTIAAGELAAMFLAHGSPIEGEVAFGLLHHWDPLQRRLALAELARVKDLGWSWQGAVVDMLWDRDPAVRDAALNALREWRGEALPALASLRAFGDFGGDFGDRCTALAETLLMAAGQADPTVRNNLREIDEALRGRLVPQHATAHDAASARALAAVLWGCRLREAATVQRLLDLALDRAPRDAQVHAAILHLLACSDAGARRAVVLALPRIGPAILQLAPELEHDLASDYGGPHAASGTVLESWAFTLAGPLASNAEVEHALDHPNSRLQIRALHELDVRGLCQSPPVCARLALWQAPAITDSNRWDSPAALYLRWSGGGRMVDAMPELQLARALANTAAGLPLVGRREAAPLAQELFGADDLDAWLGKLDAAGRLAAFAAIEAHLRERTQAEDVGAIVAAALQRK